jgi:hypothetical protein
MFPSCQSRNQASDEVIVIGKLIPFREQTGETVPSIGDVV